MLSRAAGKPFIHLHNMSPCGEKCQLSNKCCNYAQNVGGIYDQWDVNTIFKVLSRWTTNEMNIRLRLIRLHMTSNTRNQKEWWTAKSCGGTISIWCAKKYNFFLRNTVMMLCSKNDPFSPAKGHRLCLAITSTYGECTRDTLIKMS